MTTHSDIRLEGYINVTFLLPLSMMGPPHYLGIMPS
jgi:hypothetical protein